MRIVIFGDSITWGAWDSQGGWAARLHKFGNSISITSQYTTYLDVYTLGISGGTSLGLLNRFEQEITLRKDEDEQLFVIISTGINGSLVELSTSECQVPPDQYRDTLKTLITLTRKHADYQLFLGLTPINETIVNPLPWKPTHGYMSKQVRAYDEILKVTCTAETVPYLPLVHLLNDSMLADGLHPNDLGHDIIFRTVRQYLQKMYQL